MGGASSDFEVCIAVQIDITIIGHAMDPDVIQHGGLDEAEVAESKPLELPADLPRTLDDRRPTAALDAGVEDWDAWQGMFGKVLRGRHRSHSEDYRSGNVPICAVGPCESTSVQSFA